MGVRDPLTNPVSRRILLTQGAAGLGLTAIAGSPRFGAAAEVADGKQKPTTHRRWIDPKPDGRPIVVVLAQFADTQRPKYTRAAVEQVILGREFPSFRHYLGHCTYGKMDLSGSSALGWLRLAKTKAYYEDRKRHAPIKCEEVWVDAVELAKRTHDLTPYQSIIVLLGETVVYGDNGQGGGAITGIPETTLDDRTLVVGEKTFRIGNALLNPDRYAFQLIVHEVGHSFGLDHVKTSGGGIDYFDGMGGSMSDYPNSHPTMGFLAPTYNAWHRLLLGSFSSGQIKELNPGESAELELFHLNHKEAATKAVRCWKPDGKGFWMVEARFFDRLYDNPEVLPAEGVLVYDVEPGRMGPPTAPDAARVDRVSAVLVDPKPNRDQKDPSRYGVGKGSVWLPGMTCEAPPVQVAVLRRTPAGYRVRVQC